MSRIYKFEEHFCSLYKVGIIRRKSPKSPFQLETHRVIFMTIGVFLQLLCTLAGLIDLLGSQFLDINEICGNAAVASGYLMCFCRGFVLILKNKELKILLEDLEHLYAAAPGGHQLRCHLKSYSKVLIQRNRMLRNLYTFASSLFFFVPILQSLFCWVIKNQRYEFRYPLRGLYLLDMNRLSTYLFLLGFQYSTAICGALLLYNEDMIFSTSVSHLCMYYRYLGKLLSQLDAHRENEIYETLKPLIQYQYTLQRLRDAINEIFSLSTFINFTIVKILLCASTFAMFQGTEGGNFLTYIFGSFLFLSSVFMRCFYGMSLHEASSDLLFAIYDHSWYEGSPKYRKLITIMMIRANVPEELEASKFNHISMEYFKEVVMQTYQIFMFLHSFSN